jgi:cell division protease FtsH
MSEETAKLIDAEVRRLVEEGENVARKVLTDHLDQLHLLAGALLEYETLSGEESKRAIKGEDIGREDEQGKHGTPVSGHAGGLPQIKRKPRPFGDVNPQGA